MEAWSGYCYTKNEWAPVHLSIAGPCIFVLAKRFWYTQSMNSKSADAWPLRYHPVDSFGLLDGAMCEQLLFT